MDMKLPMLLRCGFVAFLIFALNRYINKKEEVGESSIGTAKVTLESLPKYAVVVASKLKSEPKWIQKISTKISVFLYHSDPSFINDEPSFINDEQYVPNLGYEAAKYLKFILDHYETLDFDSVLFLHGHEFSIHNVKCTGKICWHTKAISRKACRVSALHIVESWDWRIECFRAVPGFTSEFRLNCKKPWRDLNNILRIMGESSRLLGSERCSFRTMTNAQFGVSKECIHDQPKESYAALYRYLQSNANNSHKLLDRDKAIQLEISWGFIFSNRTSVNNEEKCLPSYILRV